MATVHMSEAEVARDLSAVLEKVRQGTEVVIEQNNRPIAVIKPSQPAGRMISEIIADLKADGSHATLDEEFSKGLQEVIDSHREPLDPPAWD